VALLIISLALLPVLTPPAVAQGALVVTDIAGRTVTVTAPVQRVILADGRQLHLIASLDSEDPGQRLVGWENQLYANEYDAWVRYERASPKLTDLPTFGLAQNGAFSAEQAIALQADLVVFGIHQLAATRDSGLVDTLQRAGIPSVFIDWRERPLENTVPSILLLGRLFGKEARAQEIADFYLGHVQRVFSRVEMLKGDRPTTFLIRSAGYGDCCSTFGRSNLGDLIERAGGNNIAIGRIPGGTGTLSPEAVLTIDPQIIIATGSDWSKTPNLGAYLSMGYDADPAAVQEQLRRLTTAPGWAGLRAVKSQRFHGMWLGFFNNPFHFAALEAMAKWQYPEQFADIDPEQTLREFHERFMPFPLSGVFFATLTD
jgi:iron complex transport system substrate-binding protein